MRKHNPLADLEFFRPAALGALISRAGRLGQWFLCIAACCLIAITNAARAEPTRQAQRLLAEAGVPGGLVVHLGCSDARLTAALRATESYTVHCLDADAARVDEARVLLRSLGVYGKVTVDRHLGGRLPYVDNLVNLVVAEDLDDVPMDEVLRVLAPRGVALVKRDGQLTKTVKPVPEEIDEWTHNLRDATGNAVARDTAVGPPTHFQWIGSPRWLRHHDHMSGLSAMVSAGGRLFYIIDLGPRWSVQMPPQWTLVARDAFSGVVLWQRPISSWHAHLWPLKHGPAEIMRRLVAEGDTVYVTLGASEPVTALDAATGHVRRTYELTAGAEEILLDDGTLFVLAHPEGDPYRELPRKSVETIRASGRDWHWDKTPRRLTAWAPDTGELLWSREQRTVPVSLASAAGRLYLHDGERVVCLDGAGGEAVWASPPIPRWKPMHVLFGPTLIVHDDVVLFAGGENLNPFPIAIDDRREETERQGAGRRRVSLGLLPRSVLRAALGIR